MYLPFLTLHGPSLLPLLPVVRPLKAIVRLTLSTVLPRKRVLGFLGKAYLTAAHAHSVHADTHNLSQAAELTCFFPGH